MGKKIVIVGGVAAGASAAARLRRLDESAEITVLERGEYVSFANCGLPYHIGEVIPKRSSLLLHTPASLRERFNIDVRIRSEAVGIDRENREVEVKDLASGEGYRLPYDVLVLATGSSPIKPPIPGIGAPNVFTLWNIPDMDQIKQYIAGRHPKTVAVIGGGFIGLETAENLHHLGLQVTIVERLEQVMAPLDFDMAQMVHRHLADSGVSLILADGVKALEHGEGKTTITLESGRTVGSDLVILAIGVHPNSQLAREAGLTLNQRQGVVVDEFLRTSDPNIYAVGDVIEVQDLVGGGKTMLPLAGPANKQGRLCADNITGRAMPYAGSQGTSVAKIFDLTVATTGLNEKQLNAAGKVYRQDYLVATVSEKSHSGYYPGATPMLMKLVFDREGRILGAQIVGQDGVDKRIDVLATSIRFGGTVSDLTQLELAYAPPYSSAKDPVNMVGFVAENMLRGLADFVLIRELPAIMEQGDTVILDVSEPDERDAGSIEGSVNIPLGRLRANLDSLDKTKPIIVYCAVGLRSYIAARILLQHGFNARCLSGGYTAYKALHYRLQAVSVPEAKEVSEVKDTGSGSALPVTHIDCSGMQCPGPIMTVAAAMASAPAGTTLEVRATDPGFTADIESWCRKTGNELVSKEKRGREHIAVLRKGRSAAPAVPAAATAVQPAASGKTIIFFSGDLDKAIASFVIANGAAAMGDQVTMFFTFWGLNLLRKPAGAPVRKPFMDTMFGLMMPRGSRKLELSKMSMFGFGKHLIRKVMRDKRVSSLEEMIAAAMHNGVRVIACTMSMDVMGITAEELIDGVELGGVGTYLGAADQANVNLFI